MSDYDDTRGGEWAGEHDWAIPAAPRKRRDIDTGSNRQAFKVASASTLSYASGSLHENGLSSSLTRPVSRVVPSSG